MKECPGCGKKFNLWQRAVGEAGDHVRNCMIPAKKPDFETLAHLAGTCRGCPAGCMEKNELSYQEKALH